MLLQLVTRAGKAELLDGKHYFEVHKTTLIYVTLEVCSTAPVHIQAQQMMNMAKSVNVFTTLTSSVESWSAVLCANLLLSSTYAHSMTYDTVCQH
jgi:hypothetical protein